MQRRIRIKVHHEEWRKIRFQLLHSIHDHDKYEQPLSDQEKEIVHSIRAQTLEKNRNNVTRTESYFTYYLQHPEVHWALLAHMVSRNGGWNMTDLKGELIPKLIDPSDREHLFQFLERANALIFQDAFPQLLLYKESVRRNKNLFHLLPYFHVSRFMRPFWEQFYVSKCSSLITIAMIVNEQNYIESRVAQNPTFQKRIFKRLFFKSQSFLQFNSVVFPYIRNVQRNEQKRQTATIGLAGRIVENFTDLKERIEIGKQLYAILFGTFDLHHRILSFAKRQEHTGSRADYWPKLFHAEKSEQQTDSITKKKKLDLDKSSFYSPVLFDAWADQTMEPPEIFDWFVDDQPFEHFQRIRRPWKVDISKAHINEMKRLALGASIIS